MPAQLGRCFTKSHYCTFLNGSFLTVLEKEWDAKFVQIQGKRLPFYIFSCERTLLENCIRHSSKCTNGYFLSYYIDLSVRDAAGETQLSLNQHILLGQASFTASLLWPMYFSHFWPKTALQFLLDGQDHKQIYIIFFLIYTWIRKPRFWTFSMFGEWTVYKQNC